MPSFSYLYDLSPIAVREITSKQEGKEESVAWKIL